MNAAIVVIIIAGAVCGGGLWLVIRQLTPGVPALGPALRGLAVPTASTAQPVEHISGVRGVLAARLKIPHRELALIGYTTERYVTEKLLFSMIGLVTPSLFALLLAVTPIRPGLFIPGIVGLGLAALFFWLVDVSIRQRAADARKEFTRHVGVYFNLVAQELAASRGPTEALERAAAVGGGWVSERIRQSLETSRLRLEPPWEGLRAVATEIGVVDLGDIGEIMTLAGSEGAQVYDTLRSRADALHTAQTLTEEDRANTATTVLYIPTSALVLVLFVITAYPALVRLVTT